MVIVDYISGDIYHDFGGKFHFPILMKIQGHFPILMNNISGKLVA